MGGNTLNVVNQLTNPLLNLTRDLELETATISNAQFIVPWLNKKYSDDELMQAMIQASTVRVMIIDGQCDLKKEKGLEI